MDYNNEWNSNELVETIWIPVHDTLDGTAGWYAENSLNGKWCFYNISDSGEYIEDTTKELPEAAPSSATGKLITPTEALEYSKSRIDDEKGNLDIVPMPGTIYGETGWYFSSEGEMEYWEVNDNGGWSEVLDTDKKEKLKKLFKKKEQSKILSKIIASKEQSAVDKHSNQSNEIKFKEIDEIKSKLEFEINQKEKYRKELLVMQEKLKTSLNETSQSKADLSLYKLEIKELKLALSCDEMDKKCLEQGLKRAQIEIKLMKADERQRAAKDAVPSTTEDYLDAKLHRLRQEVQNIGAFLQAWGGLSTSNALEDIESMIEEYFQFYGYSMTTDCFRAECASKMYDPAQIKDYKTDIELQLKIGREILNAFDSGNEVGFWRLWDRYVSTSVTTCDKDLKSIEFLIRIHFSVLPLRNNHTDTSGHSKAMHKLKQYLDTEGVEMSNYPEFTPYFALPHIARPQLHETFQDLLFHSTWVYQVRGKMSTLLETRLCNVSTPRLIRVWKSFHSHHTLMQHKIHVLESKLDQVVELLHNLFVFGVNSTQDNIVKSIPAEKSEGGKNLSFEEASECRRQLNAFAQEMIQLDVPFNTSSTTTKTKTSNSYKESKVLSYAVIGNNNNNNNSNNNNKTLSPLNLDPPALFISIKPLNYSKLKSDIISFPGHASNIISSLWLRLTVRYHKDGNYDGTSTSNDIFSKSIWEKVMREYIENDIFGIRETHDTTNSTGNILQKLVGNGSFPFIQVNGDNMKDNRAMKSMHHSIMRLLDSMASFGVGREYIATTTTTNNNNNNNDDDEDSLKTYCGVATLLCRILNKGVKEGNLPPSGPMVYSRHHIISTLQKLSFSLHNANILAKFHVHVWVIDLLHNATLLGGGNIPTTLTPRTLIYAPALLLNIFSSLSGRNQLESYYNHLRPLLSTTPGDAATNDHHVETKKGSKDNIELLNKNIFSSLCNVSNQCCQIQKLVEIMISERFSISGCQVRVTIADVLLIILSRPSLRRYAIDIEGTIIVSSLNKQHNNNSSNVDGIIFKSYDESMLESDKRQFISSSWIVKTLKEEIEKYVLSAQEKGYIEIIETILDLLENSFSTFQELSDEDLFKCTDTVINDGVGPIVVSPQLEQGNNDAHVEGVDLKETLELQSEFDDTLSGAISDNPKTNHNVFSKLEIEKAREVLRRYTFDDGSCKMAGDNRDKTNIIGGERGVKLELDIVRPITADDNDNAYNDNDATTPYHSNGEWKIASESFSTSDRRRNSPRIILREGIKLSGVLCVVTISEALNCSGWQVFRNNISQKKKALTTTTSCTTYGSRSNISRGEYVVDDGIDQSVLFLKYDEIESITGVSVSDKSREIDNARKLLQKLTLDFNGETPRKLILHDQK